MQIQKLFYQRQQKRCRCRGYEYDAVSGHLAAYATISSLLAYVNNRGTVTRLSERR